MTADLFDVLRRIADRTIQAEEAYMLCSRTLPNSLFTAMHFHEATMEVERLFSTLPDKYPVSGRKPKRETEWGDKVLIRQQVNIGSGVDDIVRAFADHEIILSLGLKEVLNVPIVRGMRTIGTINFLRETPSFNEEDAAIGQILAAALALRRSQAAMPVR